VAWLVDKSVTGMVGIGILVVPKTGWLLLVNCRLLVAADAGTEFALAVVLT
jgi:hypothetical protein